MTPHAHGDLPLFSEHRPRRGGMHAARLENSPRLQRVLALLQSAPGHRFSTRDLIERAHVAAVNSTVAELRENGFDVRCQRVSKTVWHYWIAPTVGATGDGDTLPNRPSPAAL